MGADPPARLARGMADNRSSRASAFERRADRQANKRARQAKEQPRKKKPFKKVKVAKSNRVCSKCGRIIPKGSPVTSYRNDAWHPRCLGSISVVSGGLPTLGKRR
jgi:hypothetical protein